MNITTTERLILRQVQFDDRTALAEVLSDPEVMKYSLKGVHSSSQILEYITNTRHMYEQNGFGQWVVTTRAGEFVGLCGLNKHVIEDNEIIHVMYRLSVKQQGKGYAKEAVKAVLNYVKKTLPNTTIYALIEASNIASMKVAQKTGFEYLKQAEFRGVTVDIYQTQIYKKPV